jgi:site-specific recombinase XerC
MKVSLPNGCTCSNIEVYPKTWERSNASIKKDWYFHYRFYDPLLGEKYKYGYPVQKKGMNECKTLRERQEATRILIADLWKALKERGYNPFTGIYTVPEIRADFIISPDLALCHALQKAFERLESVPDALADIKSTLKYFQQASAQLRFDQVPVKDIKRRHIIMIFDQLKKIKPIWTEATYNRYLRNMFGIFKELVKVEAIEYNPAREIEYKKKVKKIKTILDDDQRRTIDESLRKGNYTFWRFIHIFFHSGARTTEIMKVRKEDVNLGRQMVKYTIKKGTVIREVERPIKTSVMYLWEQLMTEALPGQYLFSRGLKPGDNAIRKDQIKRRWRYWVQREKEKGGLGIKATWYSLKHLNTDEMESMYGTDVAARLNEHSPDMVRNHYAVNHLAREHEIIKSASNSFVPVDN